MREFYVTDSKTMTGLDNRCKWVNGERRSVGLVSALNQYFNFSIRETSQDNCETKRNDGTSSRNNITRNDT